MSGAESVDLIKCRTCWSDVSQGDCISVSEKWTDDVRSVKDVLDFCIPLVLVEDDSLICPECFENLQICAKFIERCLYADKVLKIQEDEAAEIHTEDESQEDEAETIGDFADADSADELVKTVEVKEEGVSEKGKEHNYCNNEDGKSRVEAKIVGKRIELPKLTAGGIQFKNLQVCHFICGRCSKTFTNLDQYKMHEQDVKDAPVCDYALCTVCKVKFTKEEYRVHIREVHSTSVCEECGKSFTSLIALKSHQRNVHPKETYPCDVCGKVLKTMNSLMCHTRHVHKDDREPYQKFMCDKCPKRYEKRSSLERHLKWHDNIRDFQCQHCYKSFFTSNELLCHIRLMHSNEETFFCNICGKGFVRSDYLRRHMDYHAKYLDSSCPVCKKLFRSETKLAYHMQAGHDENGASLEKAKQAVAGKSKIPGHYKTKCVCKICKKIIANPFGLRVHYKSHLKLKSFKCSFCGVLLQSPISLKRHEELHKDPNYKYSCKICHARKSSEAELEYHTNTVHKTKRYKCHLCSEAFGRRYLLDSHQATKHAEEIIKREMILEELSKETLYLDPSEAENTSYCGPKNNKGVKVGVDDEDINEIIREVQEESGIRLDEAMEEDEEEIYLEGQLEPTSIVSLKQEFPDDNEEEEEEEGEVRVIQEMEEGADGQYVEMMDEHGQVVMKLEQPEVRYAEEYQEGQEFEEGQVVEFDDSQVRVLNAEDMIEEGEYIIYDEGVQVAAEEEYSV